MWRYAYNLRGLYETPAMPQHAGAAVQRGKAETHHPRRRADGPHHADRVRIEAGAGGLRHSDGRNAHRRHRGGGGAAAEEIGFPVVLKLYSQTITHKTDVGGVQLNLGDAAGGATAFRAIKQSVTEKAGAEHFQGVTVQPMVKLDGYELIVGSSLDPQFGPVLLFGTGGQLVEVFKDRALALPPLNTTLARRMMEQTKIFKALKGVRGRKPVDLPALEDLLVRFSQLVVEQRWIKEIDINPLLASPERLLALDARVVLHGPEVTEEHLPEAAIRPYPIHLVATGR